MGFGFLPIGPHNTIAEVLGIPIGVEACTILSQRRLEKLDVGLINNRYFVSRLHIYPARLKVVYDDRFMVQAKHLMEVIICNLQPFYWKRNRRDSKVEVIHPQDGKLEAFLRPLTKGRWWGYTYEEPSIFPFKEMLVTASEPFTVEADGKTSKELKLLIRMAKEKIHMVVGRDRKF